jgi:hypothetical protein
MCDCVRAVGITCYTGACSLYSSRTAMPRTLWRAHWDAYLNLKNLFDLHMDPNVVFLEYVHGYGLRVLLLLASWECGFSMWFRPLLNPPLNPIPYPGGGPANCSKLPMTRSIISKSKKKMYVGTLIWWVISSELTPFSEIHWWFLAQEIICLCIYIIIPIFTCDQYSPLILCKHWKLIFALINWFLQKDRIKTK